MRPYDVVITDAQMPDVDGFMLAARDQAAIAGFGKIPIVMLTSMGRTEDTARLRRLGITRFLTKPVKHSDLLDALASIFGSAEARRPQAPAAPPRTCAAASAGPRRRGQPREPQARHDAAARSGATR